MTPCKFADEDLDSFLDRFQLVKHFLSEYVCVQCIKITRTTCYSRINFQIINYYVRVVTQLIPDWQIPKLHHTRYDWYFYATQWESISFDLQPKNNNIDARQLSWKWSSRTSRLLKLMESYLMLQCDLPLSLFFPSFKNVILPKC